MSTTPIRPSNPIADYYAPKNAQRARRLYESGLCIDEIARRLDLTHYVARGLVLSAGGKLRPAGPHAPNHARRDARIRASSGTLAEIAKRFRLSRERIRQIRFRP